jgi:hypothetical protein
MKIRLESFSGMIPRRNARLLPDTGSELAENTKLWSGKIKPWKGNELVCDPFQTVPKSIYLFAKNGFPPGYWFQFAETDVDVVKGQVGGDETERTYITGGPVGQPQVTDIFLAVRGEEEVWSASEHYTTGNIVVGTGTSGVYFECTTAGTADVGEPTWNTTPSATTNDGSVVWTARTLTDSTLCDDLPDVSVNLGVPAPVAAPTTERASISGSIAGIGDHESTQQAQTGTYPTPFVVTADGSSQLLTMEISVQIIIAEIVDVSDSIDINLWRDTAAVNPVSTINVTRDNWDSIEQPIPTQNESGIIYHKETLTENVALGAGPHSYSCNVKVNNFNVDPGQISVKITYSATYGASGGVGNGISIELGTLTENPFEVGSTILINEVVGVANSSFEEINGSHEVVSVGGNTVMISIANLDPADYLSGGTWEFIPNEQITFERFYVYTYIARMGTLLQEGPPSPVSTVLGLTDNSGVDLSGMSVPPANFNISRIRIYRTVLGNDSAEFKFVEEIGASNTTYSDTLKEGSTNIGELLLSEDWGPPPTDMHSIVQMPNGIMVGLSKNEVFLSEPFQPHAWPDKYRRSMNFDGVSTGVFGNTVLITTKGVPYLLTGNDPGDMVMDKLELSQSCVSKRSTVDMGYSVLYASPDGLVQVGPGIANLATGPLFTKDEWGKLNPSSMLAARWDDRYVAFYTKTNGDQGGFVFDPKNAEASYTTLDLIANAAHTDPDDGDLFLITGANNLVQFDESDTTDLDFLWRSKRFHVSRPLNFGAAQVSADGYPVGLTLYSIEKDEADESENQRIVRFTGSVNNNKPFRLPAGYTSDEYQIELSGNTTIESVYVAETLRELNLV